MEAVGEVDRSLSDDAKAVLAAWFGMGRKTTLTLRLRESVPTPRCRAALDELVAAGALSKERFNEYGGEVYKPLVDTLPYFGWMGRNLDNPNIKFDLMQPVI